MNAPIASQPFELWGRKKTYIWLLVGIGVIDGVLLVFGKSHLQIDAGRPIFSAFAINVAALGWCYTDAKDRMVPVSGLLRFVMLFIAIIGVPWYFLRSRGFIQAAKGGFGLGLFALWFGVTLFAGVIAVIAQNLLFR